MIFIGLITYVCIGALAGALYIQRLLHLVPSIKASPTVVARGVGVFLIMVVVWLPYVLARGFFTLLYDDEIEDE